MAFEVLAHDPGIAAGTAARLKMITTLAIDAFEANDRVLLIDDLLATGGTAKASCDLIEKLGAKVEACAFVLELDFLGGRDKLRDYEVHSLLHF